MSSLPALGVALAGLSHAAGPGLIDWARDAGFRAVRLDATAPGMRPRELGRSARRDLAAALRRRELRFAGLDFRIPTEHFEDPAHIGRALDAALAAVEFAAEIAGLTDAGGAVLCLSFPAQGADSALAHLAATADASGVDLADHAHPPREARSDAPPRLLLGLDPAAVLQAGDDPASAAARAGGRLAAASLSDMGPAGRCAPIVPASLLPSPGVALVRRGRLDLGAYLVALAAAGHDRPLVLDLRAVSDAEPVARAFAGAWRNAGGGP